MELNIMHIIFVIINFALLIIIGIVIYKAIQFVKRIITLDKKVDILLNKLEDKDI